MRNKLPPYASGIAAARRMGVVPERTFGGHIIIVFEYRPKYLIDIPYVVLPPDHDPTGFVWSFCASLDVCIVHTDNHPIALQKSLAGALLKANINKLRALNIDGVAAGRPYSWLEVVPLCEANRAWQ